MGEDKGAETMSTNYKDLPAVLELEIGKFNDQLSRVAQMIGRNGASYVRTTARRLIKKAAFNCPIRTGRARAGFWPAATALSIGNIYTPLGNRGEGSAENKTDSNNPAFTFRNSVPYITIIKGKNGGLHWWNNAIAAVQARMAADLEKYAKKSWEREDLIEELTGD